MRSTHWIPATVGLTALAALTAAAGATSVNTSALSENGWFSDDTRADGLGSESAGTNLISDTLTDDPEGTASGSPAHDADITTQITFIPAPGAVPAGTFAGAVNLFIGPSGSGKSQITHRIDDGTGHAPGSSFGPAFSAEYSWMGDGTPTVTASIKFGIKTADFGSTGVSSRTGENVWDKIMIYEPGNLNGGLSDGAWRTETIDYTTGRWWFFDRTVIASTIGMPLTLSDMSTSTFAFSGGKTIADVYALITAPGAHITSVQVGIGSGNPGGSVYVNQMATNFYRPGDVTTFGPAGDLTVEADSCQDDTDLGEAGYQIEVEVWMRNLPSDATGFQAFLTYDTAVLAYRGTLSSYTVSPFALHIQDTATAEVVAGELRFDGSAPFNDPGTDADSLLATLVFDVVEECDLTTVDFDLTQLFDSELSLNGEAIATNLIAEEFSADDTPPVITCPPDVTIECDESTAPPNTGEPTFAQGFETGRDGWFDFGGALTRVPSGTDGITSADGSWHAELSGAFTRWGGYSSTFPTGGYTTTADVYFDVDGGYSNDSRFDFSSAINNAAGSHRRDFVMSGGFYDDADSSPETGLNRFVFSASNNTPGFPKDPARSPYTITVTGWYTISHTFYDDGFGVLACDIELIDDGGTTLSTWTLSDVTDIIGVTVGGNRYGWFLNLSFLMQIDNTARSGGGQMAYDNCDSDPVVTFMDDVSGIGCGGTGTLLRTWTATDFCGNESSCVQTITIEDTTPPTITCPADIEVNADAGGCDATLSLGMIGTPTTGDNCAVDVVSFVRSDGKPNLDDPYDSADSPITITWTATDCGGNTADCDQTITVNAVNTVNVTVELAGSSLPGGGLTRCIRFVTDACGNTADVEVDFTVDLGGSVEGTATFEIGCGDWDLLCAKDQQHTQWDSTTLSVVGTEYSADTVLVLEPGDTDNDGDVDIQDVTWLVFTFGDLAADGDCAWDGTRDADFDNDGAVGTEDYDLLVLRWLTVSSCGCTSAAGLPAKGMIVTTALDPRLVKHVDLNRDGIIDFRDIRIFEDRHALSGMLSTAMLQAQLGSQQRK